MVIVEENLYWVFVIGYVFWVWFVYYNFVKKVILFYFIVKEIEVLEVDDLFKGI